MLKAILMLSPIAVGLLTLSAVLIGIGWIKTATFLRETPRLRHRGDMERYKDVARFGMWGALGLIGLMPPAFLVLTFLPASLTYRVAGIAASALVALVGVALKKKETLMQETVADTDELAAERDRVTESWLKKLFPDF